MDSFTSNLLAHAFFIHGSSSSADLFGVEQVQPSMDQSLQNASEKGTWLSTGRSKSQPQICAQNELKGQSSLLFPCIHALQP